MELKSTTYSGDICTIGSVQELALIREFVGTRASEFGFDENDTYKITLAVDEACSNLIRHAYKFDNSKFLCIEIQTNNLDFSILISDDGQSFDLTEVDSPKMNEYFQQFKQGGLGIHIIKLVMDQIEYFPHNDEHKKNILKMTKILKNSIN